MSDRRKTAGRGLLSPVNLSTAMARSEKAQEYVEWREGAIVFAAMLAGAIVGGGGLHLLEVPWGWLIGGILGLLIVFFGYSYLRFGRG